MPGQASPLSWVEYATRWAILHGGVDPRRSSVPVRGWLRMSYSVGRVLARARVAPNVVTLAGLGWSAAVPAAVALGGGWVFAGAACVLVSCVADSADGAVALISARATRLGGFYDAVADRLSEACWLLGAWLLGAPGWLVIGCAAMTWLHEYARARATASGMADIGVVTVAERPTRAILIILALLLGGLARLVSPRLVPGAVTLVVALWLVLSLLGAARLTGAIRTSLAHRPVP
jgi:phosphatidylglycerophosphate synthase